MLMEIFRHQVVLSTVLRPLWHRRRELQCDSLRRDLLDNVCVCDGSVPDYGRGADADALAGMA